MAAETEGALFKVHGYTLLRILAVADIRSGHSEISWVAQKGKQEHEQVDEIEVQVQRAHDRRLAQPFLIH